MPLIINKLNIPREPTIPTLQQLVEPRPRPPIKNPRLANWVTENQLDEDQPSPLPPTEEHDNVNFDDADTDLEASPVQPTPTPTTVNLGPLQPNQQVKANSTRINDAAPMDLDTSALAKSQRALKSKVVRLAPNQPRYSLEKRHVRLETRPLHELFEIGPVLGQGAFGVVRSCIRLEDRLPVAVKQISLKGKSPEEITQAETETTIMLQTSCDDESFCALVRIYDSFFTGAKQYLFIVMDLVDGGDGDTVKAKLHNELKSNPFGSAQWKSTMSGFLRTSAPLLYTLREVHEKKVLHRDIKPPNLLFDKTKRRLLLSDFGLACMRMGCDGNLAGSPAYMDPRSLQCGILDIWSDIYALGATLFEMVTNEMMVEFLPTDDQWEGYHQRRMAKLDPILSQYKATDPEYPILVSIKLMTTPLDHTKRPSLASIMTASKERNPNLLSHQGDTEWKGDAAAVCYRR
jgi:serine/threonine protein kinase